MGQFGEVGFDVSEDRDNFGKYRPGCLLIFTPVSSKGSLLSWGKLAGRASAPLK